MAFNFEPTYQTFKLDDPVTILRFNYTDERELFEVNYNARGCVSSELLTT